MGFCVSRNSRPTVDVLTFVFGFGSWVAMTGLWMELPLLVQKLPEGPALASFLSLALQAANVGCILYAAAYKLRPLKSTEDISIHLQMALGTVSAILLVFFWNLTVEIAGTQRSVALLTLSFAMSLVDCVSSVSFLPYMARFRSVYMTPYLSGEGVGGLFPGLIAMAQGIGETHCTKVNVTEGNQTQTEFRSVLEHPRFTESVFLASLVVIFLFSWIAFSLLNSLPVALKEQVCCENNQTPLSNVDKVDYASTESIIQSSKIQDSFTKRHYIYFMFLQGWASLATFGIFPAIQPYSLIPYGYPAFHWGVILCGFSYPVACAFAAFVEARGPWSLGLLSFAATVFGILIIITALLSPQPPLYGTDLGAVLVVCFWVAYTLLFSYVKTMVTVVLLEVRGHNAMFWVGVVTQVGGVVGSMVMFLLVNVSSGIFTSPDECQV